MLASQNYTVLYTVTAQLKKYAQIFALKIAQNITHPTVILVPNCLLVCCLMNKCADEIQNYKIANDFLQGITRDITL